LTHGPAPPEERHRIGFLDGLPRLSAGIEDISDPAAEFEQALQDI
jgi:cystathionine beta-lyase/cystathionine gamma-synthase